MEDNQTVDDYPPFGFAAWQDGSLGKMNQMMKMWFPDNQKVYCLLEPMLRELNDGRIQIHELLEVETASGRKQMRCTALQISSGGEGKQILIFMEDWTETLRTKRALEDKILQLESHFNSSADLHLITALDGTILNINPQSEKTLGYPVAEMIGKQWIVYVSDEKKEAAEKILMKLHKGENVSEECLKFIVRDGREVWLEWNASRQGRFIHANIRDVTKRIQTEEQNLVMQEHVARAQKMESIGRLAGGIAHEFNNSLQVIIGNAELIYKNPKLPDSNKRQLGDILSAAKSSAQLTEQLLGFAMKQQVVASNIHLNQALEEMIPLFKTILGDQIHLQFHLDSERSIAKINQNQLEQIFLNFLENAKNAMPTGGVVTIETQNRVLKQDSQKNWLIDFNPGEYVWVSIRDEGTGIDPQIQPTLFEPFSTTHDASQGSGLGLATIHGILKQNNGSIRWTSVLNEGTCFEILLPIGTEEVTHKNHQLDLPLLRKEDIKILLVDDNPQILQMGMMLLQNLQYSVIPCNEPTEALGILKNNPDISLLITDVLMPKLSGMELYESAIHVQPEMKCVFMSGYSQEVIDSNYLKPGKSVYISKPFTVKTIQETLNSLFPLKKSGAIQGEITRHRDRA